MTWGLADAIAEAMQKCREVAGPYDVVSSVCDNPGMSRIWRQTSGGNKWFGEFITGFLSHKYAMTKSRKLNKLFLEGKDPYLKQEE